MLHNASKERCGLKPLPASAEVSGKFLAVTCARLSYSRCQRPEEHDVYKREDEIITIMYNAAGWTDQLSKRAVRFNPLKKDDGITEHECRKPAMLESSSLIQL